MIEQWASRRKVHLRGALDGVQATAYADATSPLLKFHGCMQIDPGHTLWTQGQLALPEITRRVDSCKAWMQMNLPARDLLVVGFWTDWGYFNDVLAGILGDAATSSITVVDPQSTADLMAKAPALWATLSASTNFVHVSASGNEVLPEIRKAYSKVWARKLYRLGAPLYQAARGIAPPDGGFNPPDLDV